MTASRIRWFFLGSTLLSIAVAWGLALPLAGAAVLAFVSEGPIDFILLRLGQDKNPRMRWAVSAAFVFLIVAGLLLPLTFAAVGAVRELITLLSGINWDNAATWGTGSIDWARRRASEYGLDVSETEITDRLRSALTSSFAFLGARLGALISSTPTLLFDVGILLFAWVSFAVQGKSARDRVLPHLLPWDEEREILRKTTGEVLRSVLVANVVVSAAQAGIASVALVVVQAPRALVWGTLSFFLSFVPVVGTMPITLGTAVYCYSQGRVGSAVFMVAIAGVIGLVDNILRPVFMKSSANLSFLWTFVAFVGGVALLGLPGVLVGPLAFSLFTAYLRAMEDLREKQAAPTSLVTPVPSPLPAPAPVPSIPIPSIPSIPPRASGAPPPHGKGRGGKKRR
ncbi:MAG: AI-2E family transporter [Byssovorax sp.]